MSIEFTTELDNSLEESALSRIIEALQTGDRYRLVRSTSQEAGFSQTTNSHGGTESITIYFHDHRIDIAFHLASVIVRDDFISRLINSLRKEGIDSNFEEI
jgi:hypothetical protein